MSIRKINKLLKIALEFDKKITAAEFGKLVKVLKND